MKCCPTCIEQILQDRAPDFVKKRHANEAKRKNNKKKQKTTDIRYICYQSCSYGICSHRKYHEDDISNLDMYQCITRNCQNKFHRLCLQMYLYNNHLLSYYNKKKLAPMCENHLAIMIEAHADEEGDCCFDGTTHCSKTLQ